MARFLYWVCLLMALLFASLGEYVAYYGSVVSWEALAMALFFLALAFVPGGRTD